MENPIVYPFLEVILQNPLGSVFPAIPYPNPVMHKGSLVFVQYRSNGLGTFVDDYTLALDLADWELLLIENQTRRNLKNLEETSLNSLGRQYSS